MKSLTKTLATLGLIGAVALGNFGCKPKYSTSSENWQKITVITENADRSSQTEIFQDDNSDGEVDAYIGGPTDKDDRLIPDINSKKTLMCMSQSSVDRFYEKNPTAPKNGNLGRSYWTGNTATFSLPHTIMNPVEQRAIDAKYNVLQEQTTSINYTFPAITSSAPLQVETQMETYNPSNGLWEASQ